MARKSIEVSLKTNDEVINNKLSAIVNDKEIKYNENNVIVKLSILDNKIIMIRENNEYRLQLIFENNGKKNLGNYLLKTNNMTFDLEILTKDLNINKNNIHIIYELNDEIREYNIYIEE